MTTEIDNQQPGNEKPQRRGRGFASMSPEEQRQIASVGGRASQASGNAHRFDSAEAREAGRKGGRVVSQNREHMSAIGSKGGRASGGGANRNAAANGGNAARPMSGE
jgi:uncharacterized protein